MDSSTASQISYTMKWLVPLDLIAGGILGGIWYAFGYSDTPVEVLTGAFVSVDLAGPIVYTNATFVTPIIAGISLGNLNVPTFNTLAASRLTTLVTDLCAFNPTSVRHYRSFRRFIRLVYKKCWDGRR